MSSLIDTFWIQCATCNSWYHVAKSCIGLSDQQANHADYVWNCPSCISDSETDEEMSSSDKNCHGTDDSPVNTIRFRDKTHQFVDSLQQSPTIRPDKASFVHQSNNCQDLALIAKQPFDNDIPDRASKSAQQSRSTLLLDAKNISTTSSPILVKEVSTSKSMPRHTPQQFSDAPHQKDRTIESGPLSLHSKRQNKKKNKVSHALRELKSYNMPGLSYWECFESESLPFNPDRCLRKRKATIQMYQCDQGRGKGSVLSSTEPENESGIRYSNKKQNQPRAKEKGKPPTKSMRVGNRSTRKQLKSVVENEDASIASAAVLVRPDGKATNSKQIFKVGDLVYVKGHAWAYVNNSGGIGKIQKAYDSENGDRVYDVKYPALDRTERRISVEFISSYSFD